VDQPFLSSTTYAHLTDPTSTSQPRGATGDLDMLVYDDHGVVVPLCPPGLAVGITCQLTGTRNIGRDAVDLAALVVTGPKSKTGEFFVRFVRAGGTAPQHVKYVAFELAGLVDIVTHDTASGTAYGHSNGRQVASVGAASWYLTGAFDSYFSTSVQATTSTPAPALWTLWRRSRRYRKNRRSSPLCRYPIKGWTRRRPPQLRFRRRQRRFTPGARAPTTPLASRVFDAPSSRLARVQRRQVKWVRPDVPRRREYR
jgi:hypothetical protein